MWLSMTPRIYVGRVTSLSFRVRITIPRCALNIYIYIYIVFILSHCRKLWNSALLWATVAPNHFIIHGFNFKWPESFEIQNLMVWTKKGWSDFIIKTCYYVSSLKFRLLMLTVFQVMHDFCCHRESLLQVVIFFCLCRNLLWRHHICDRNEDGKWCYDFLAPSGFTFCPVMMLMWKKMSTFCAWSQPSSI